MLKKMVFMLLAMWLFAGQCLAAGVTVTIKPEVTLPGPYIRLGELAVIDSDNQDRAKIIGDIKLGSAPPPGSHVVLTAEMLGARLAGSGADLSGVRWQVPPAMTIYTAGQTVSGETLLAAAEAAIKERLGIAAGRETMETTVAALTTPHDVIVPLGQTDFKADIPAGIRFNTPTTVNVTINVNGHPFSAVGVKFNVKAYQNVVVTARSMAAFEVITPDSLRLERFDIGRLTGYITDSAKVLGLRTRRPVTAGTPLCEAAIEKPPVVKRGSAVTVLARVGEIVVTANGQALQEGSEGAIIRVQNLNSNKIINARVVDGATVQVIIYSGR